VTDKASEALPRHWRCREAAPRKQARGSGLASSASLSQPERQKRGRTEEASSDSDDELSALAKIRSVSKRLNAPPNIVSDACRNEAILDAELP
jgi:hypothetical protein